MGWVVNATPRPLYSRERDAVLTVQDAGRAPGPVWTGEDNICPTGIRSPDPPARSVSLYRLSYSGPMKEYITLISGFRRDVDEICAVMGY